MKRSFRLFFITILLCLFVCGCGNEPLSFETEISEDGSYIIHNESGDSFFPKNLPFSMEYNGKSLICESINVYESYENYGYTAWAVVTVSAKELDDAEFHWLLENDVATNLNFTGDIALSLYVDEGQNQIDFDSLNVIGRGYTPDKYLYFGFYSKDAYKHTLSGTEFVTCFDIYQDEKYESESSDGIKKTRNKHHQYQHKYIAEENLASPDKMPDFLVEYFDTLLTDKHIANSTASQGTPSAKKDLPAPPTTSPLTPSCEKDGVTIELVNVDAGNYYVDITFKITNNTESTLIIEDCRRNYFNGISLEQYGVIEYDPEIPSGKSTLYELTLENNSVTVAGTTINDIELNIILNEQPYVFDFHNLNIITKASNLSGLQSDPYNGITLTIVGADISSYYADFYFELENTSAEEIEIKANRRYYINGVSVEQYGNIEYEPSVPAGHGTAMVYTLEKDDLQTTGNAINEVEISLSINGETHSFSFKGLNVTY